MQLPPFKLERYFAEHEFTCDHLLCASDCETISVGELLALEPDAESRLYQLRLGYTESLGHPDLRGAIASAVYATLDPEDILVCAGAEEAIFAFMHAVAVPGGNVVVHTPCYQSLRSLPAALGCEVRPWLAREENGWGLDVEELDQLVDDDTCAIVLNTPHNPTGYLMPAGAFEQVIAIARKSGIPLFSDEVYRNLEYDPDHRLPCAADRYEHAVSLGVLSKAHGLPGLRIGWAATADKQLLARTAAFKDYTTICSSAPSEFLAMLALRHQQFLLDRSQKLIQSNLVGADRFFARHGDRFSWHRPRAGCIAFPRYLPGDAARFCERLLEETGVLLLPGSQYDADPAHFRLGYGRSEFRTGLAVLDDWLQRE